MSLPLSEITSHQQGSVSTVAYERSDSVPLDWEMVSAGKVGDSRALAAIVLLDDMSIEMENVRL